MRILIQQRLRKFKYPPEGYEDAIAPVLKQAEELADVWVKRRRCPCGSPAWRF
jgi:hypothetical protein